MSSTSSSPGATTSYRSRARNGVDLITGEALDDALTGVDTVIDAATGPSPDQQAATEFFTTSTRNLQQDG